jgi:hypothetical protein
MFESEMSELGFVGFQDYRIKTELGFVGLKDYMINPELGFVGFQDYRIIGYRKVFNPSILKSNKS